MNEDMNTEYTAYLPGQTIRGTKRDILILGRMSSEDFERGLMNDFIVDHTNAVPQGEPPF